MNREELLKTARHCVTNGACYECPMHSKAERFACVDLLLDELMGELENEAVKPIGDQYDGDAICPRCGATLVSTFWIDGRETYCELCGQKLDWGEPHD